MKTHRPIKTGLTLLFTLALIAAPSESRTAAAAATVFSGRATVISGQVAGIPITLVDTGPVDASGGHLHQSVLEYPIDGVPDATGGALTAGVLHATVVAEGNKSRAEAVVADFALKAAGQKISAEFLGARASATCSSGTATITESSEIVGLVVTVLFWLVLGTSLWPGLLVGEILGLGMGVPLLVPVLMVGTTHVSSDLVVSLTRLLFPIVVLMGLTGVVTGILGSMEFRTDAMALVVSWATSTPSTYSSARPFRSTAVA